MRPEKKTSSLGNWLGGGILLFVGFQFLGAAVTILSFAPLMGIPLFAVGILMIIQGGRLIAGKEPGKGKKSSRRQSARPAPTGREKSRNFSFREDDHQHIVPTGLSVEKRLAQLEVLRDAGLYTKEEYRAAREKILGQ